MAVLTNTSVPVLPKLTVYLLPVFNESICSFIVLQVPCGTKRSSDKLTIIARTIFWRGPGHILITKVEQHSKGLTSNRDLPYPTFYYPNHEKISDFRVEPPFFKIGQKEWGYFLPHVGPNL
jgi:hypothetical protein